jgi:hypothetical protein
LVVIGGTITIPGVGLWLMLFRGLSALDAIRGLGESIENPASRTAKFKHGEQLMGSLSGAAAGESSSSAPEMKPVGGRGTN